MNHPRSIHVKLGPHERIRAFDVGVKLSVGSNAENQWHKELVSVPAKGELNGELSEPASRIVNAVIKRFGGCFEVRIVGTEIHLQGEESTVWDRVDIDMMLLIANELFPDQAVEMTWWYW